MMGDSPIANNAPSKQRPDGPMSLVEIERSDAKAQPDDRRHQRKSGIAPMITALDGRSSPRIAIPADIKIANRYDPDQPDSATIRSITAAWCTLSDVRELYQRAITAHRVMLAPPPRCRT